ncbi:integrase arm-type DNA-binding domain-containing protein [Frankia sp. RB7]|nr:integrase arm-type DNA-binding domain-containing protein [Frankia sp. RB7]
MTRPALTKRTARDAQPETERFELRDGKVKGLRLVIYPSGQKSWGLRYRTAEGEARRYVIGELTEALGLDEARKIAADLKLGVVKGADPSNDKREARRTGTTVRDVFDRYDRLYLQKEVRPVTAARARSFFKAHVFPAIGDDGIADVKRRDILDILDSLADYPAAQNRGQAVMSGFFSWAVEREIINASPSANIKARGEVVSRDRVLSDNELRRIWRASDGAGYPFGPMVKLLILTMGRRTEVAAMAKAELNRDDRQWQLPRERSKNSEAHSVHLTDAALAVLNSLPSVDDCDFVFTTNGEAAVSGFSKMKDRLDELIGEGMQHWTIHDLRRTGATLLQRLGFSKEVIDACLNHKIQGVAAVYQRYEFQREKVKAFEALAREIDRIVSGQTDSNVVQLNRPGV